MADQTATSEKAAIKMTWDGMGNYQLLLAILAEQAVSINAEALASRIGCTTRAVQEQLKKLKKQAAAMANGTEVVPVKRGSIKKAKGDDGPDPKPKKRKMAVPKGPKRSNTSTKISTETTNLNGINVEAGNRCEIGDTSSDIQVNVKSEHEKNGLEENELGSAVV